MSTRGTVTLASRGSALALEQAARIVDALKERRYAVDLVTVETTGDQLREEVIHRLGKTGAFARAVDEAVLDGEADAAVHSMKDLPTEFPDSMIVAGIPPRARPEDVLVTPSASPLEALPDGARVGTSSLRRTAQLLAARPDLEVEPLRGNVDTRVEKLLAPALQAERDARREAESTDSAEEDAVDGVTSTSGESEPDGSVGDWIEGLSELERRALDRRVETDYDAIVLAAAGLERSGLLDQVGTVALPVREFVPAPAQGAIAVTAVDGTDAAEAIHEAVDDPRTRVETTVERVILSAIGAGCIAPIGVHAIVQGERVHATAQILEPDGTAVIEGSRDLPVRTYLEDAESFAAGLIDRGAAELIERTRETVAGREAPRGDE